VTGRSSAGAEHGGRPAQAERNEAAEVTGLPEHFDVVLDGFGGRNYRLVLIGTDLVQQRSLRAPAYRSRAAGTRDAPSGADTDERTDRLDAHAVDWWSFVRELRAAGVHHWYRHYHDRRPSAGVRWRIAIRWQAMGLSVDVSGEKAYPPAFEQVVTALARLIGELPALETKRQAVPA
jgi:hypothetical protein